MNILITDFDGTISKIDFYQTALDLGYADPAGADMFWKAYTDGEITHFAAMKGIMGSLRVAPEQIGPALDAMLFDPQFAEACAALAAANWAVAIVSAGCEWYIAQHLRRAGVAFTIDHTQLRPGLIYVASNPGTFTSETQGIELSMPVGSPFLCEDVGIDKPAVARYMLSIADIAAFAGDGRPDYAPAMLVAPERRFATGWLAEELARNGEQFTRFDVWHEVVNAVVSCQWSV